MENTGEFMKVDIIISAGDIKSEKVKNKTVVVIDMLRATSVITTAIANGCSEVIPVLSVEEALELTRKDRKKYLLGGERKALKIEGFDFSNSPLEYTKDIIIEKSIVLTTTNGTRAIKGCEGAKHIFIGAMINAFQLAYEIVALNNDIVLVNAGTYDEFSIDDFICSGYIIDCILSLASGAKKNSFHNAKKLNIELLDIAKTAHYVYKMNKDIKGFIKEASHYKRIEDLGLTEDLEYCCQKSITKVVPIYEDGIIRSYKITTG
jgi:2-phosphosulfolactate phosphatase